MKKIKVLFVCMGNICRSPTAEGTFRAHVEKQQKQDLFIIDSAGTHSYHIGNPPDKRSQESAIKHNVDVSTQISRQVVDSDFYYYDYIVAMDSSNLTQLQLICPSEHQHKLSLLFENLPKTSSLDVPDPYYQGRFDEVFTDINEASNFLLQKLIKDHQKD